LRLAWWGGLVGGAFAAGAAGAAAAATGATLSAVAPSPPAVDARLPEYRARANLRGDLTLARTASTDTLVATWARRFEGLNPGVNVRQTVRSTDLPAAALDELLDGTVKLAPFVREIQPAELAAATRRWGYAPLGIAVASGSYATPSNTHAIAVYVNAANPLTRLTLAQLDAIYSAARRRGAPEAIVTWGQLGLTGEWTGRPIHAYSMVVNRKVGNPHSGIVAYLMERLMQGGEFRSDLHEVPDTGMGRGNNRALDEIVAAVAADPAAIGYAGFANGRPGARTLALAEDPAGPFCAGTREEVARRVYPLTRTIFVFVRRVPGRPLDPVVRAFVEYILSRDGQAAVAADAAGFLPLPAAFASEQRARLGPPP
jgi:phosphate transport system substrate-binding protein